MSHLHRRAGRPARGLIALLVTAALGLALSPAALADSSSSRQFIRSAVVNADHTVTLPLLRGTSGGQTVWYVVLDASTSNAADRYGANRASKLANARGTAAVEKVGIRNGVIDFPATVDFGPTRHVAPGPTGFPPAAADPGAVGAAGYNPLIQLPDRTVLNAPQIANGTGHAGKVVSIDTGAGAVRYELTDGSPAGSM